MRRDSDMESKRWKKGLRFQRQTFFFSFSFSREHLLRELSNGTILWLVRVWVFGLRLSEWPGWIIRFLKDAVVSRRGECVAPWVDRVDVWSEGR